MDTPLFVNDPELGKLRAIAPGTYRLPRRLKLPPIDGTFLILLNVMYDRQIFPVQSFQRGRIQWLRQNSSRLHRPMESALANYYRPYRVKHLAEFVLYRGNQWAGQNVPELKADSDVWELVSPSIVEVLRENHLFGYDVEVGFTAAWDEEHGVAVKFLDGRIVGVTEVGFCGIGHGYSEPAIQSDGGPKQG